MRDLPRRMRGIEHLDSREAALGEIVDDRDIPQPPGMRDHRNAAARRNGIDRVVRGNVMRGLVAGPTAREHRPERRLHVAHHPAANEGFGNVRPPERIAAARFGKHVIERQRIPRGGEPFGHPADARTAMVAIALGERAHRSLAQIEAVAENVHVVIAPGRVDFDAGDHARCG